MKKQDVLNTLNDEIVWHKRYISEPLTDKDNKEVSIEYKKGFIDGLKQAKKVIKKCQD